MPILHVRRTVKSGDTPVSSHSLSTSITLQPTKRREERNLDRNKADRERRRRWKRVGANGRRRRRDATRRRIVCDFVLPLAATSRSRSSISHTSVPTGGRRPRRDREPRYLHTCTRTRLSLPPSLSLSLSLVLSVVRVKERKVA